MGKHFANDRDEVLAQVVVERGQLRVSRRLQRRGQRACHLCTASRRWGEGSIEGREKGLIEGERDYLSRQLNTTVAPLKWPRALVLTVLSSLGRSTAAAAAVAGSELPANGGARTDVAPAMEQNQCGNFSRAFNMGPLNSQ